MISLPFPTDTFKRDGGAPPLEGWPWPATPCTCHPCAVMGDSCVLCGHFTAQVITRTWHRRALFLNALARA